MCTFDPISEKADTRALPINPLPPPTTTVPSPAVIFAHYIWKILMMSRRIGELTLLSRRVVVYQGENEGHAEEISPSSSLLSFPPFNTLFQSDFPGLSCIEIFSPSLVTSVSTFSLSGKVFLTH